MGVFRFLPGQTRANAADDGDNNKKREKGKNSPFSRKLNGFLGDRSRALPCQ
jgi:hypothetical protein